MVNPDLFPHVILRGDVAGLSALRTIQIGKGEKEEQADDSSSSLLQTFFDERGGQPLLASPMKVSICWNASDDEADKGVESGDGRGGDIADTSQYADAEEGEASDSINQGPDETATTTNGLKDKQIFIPGNLFISSSQILFVAERQDSGHKANSDYSSSPSSSSSGDNDLAIGATCITLHAMMDEPEPAMYLQLSDGGDDRDDGNNTDHDGPLELTITPTERKDINCQILFDHICRLVSQWPVDVDDDGDNFGVGRNCQFSGSELGEENVGNGGWMTADGIVEDLEGDDDGRDHLIWAHSPNADDVEKENDDGGATEEERAAMLDRLDNLLVVPRDMEIEGQFDDAE
jgi:hypothetical protein